MEFRDKVMSYFCDVSKHVAMVIRNQGPPEAFSNVYKMAGYMVKYCAPLLFIEVGIFTDISSGKALLTAARCYLPISIVSVL